MNLLELYAKLGLDVSDYERGLLGAENSAKGFGSRLGGAFKTIAKVGVKALTAATGAATAFGATAVKAGMSFDASMSQVAATMGLTVEQMEQSVGSVELAWGSFSGNLREFAQEMGKNTVFSATQAADALNYMALAGYSVQESMEALPSVLNLAAAGNFDLARASDMVTDTQTAFGLTAERTAQMVDEMAKAASTGNTSVEQLGDAFLVVGGLAQELNGGMITLADGTQAEVDGLQELEIALTAMANAGIKGSEAGTHMRNMLLKLSSPTDAGTIALEELGVAVFDSAGKMRSLRDIMGDLSFVMGSLSQDAKLGAISDLFNTRDIASAEAIMNALGDSAGAVSGKLKDSGINFKNVSGAVNRLGIELSGADQILEGMTQDLIYYRRVGMDNEQMLELLQEDYKLTGEEAEKAIKAMTEGLDDISNDWDEIGEAILGAEGAAQKMADTQLDNLAGDITLFKSALEGAQIAISDQLTPSLREFVQFGSDSISRITDAFQRGGFTAAIDVAAEAIGSLTEKVMEYVPKLVQAGAKLLGAIVEGIIKKLPDLAKAAAQLIVDLGKYIVKNAPKIIKTAGEVIKAFAKGLGDAIPSLKPVTKLLGFLGDNFETVTRVLKPLVAGFVAFKAAVAIHDKIQSVTKAVSSLSDGFKNMASGNVIGAAVGGVVALVSAFKEIYDSKRREQIKAAMDEFEKGFSVYRESMEKTKASVENLMSAEEARKETVNKALVEFDEEEKRIQGIRGELELLIDANGNVKEGYEERAEVLSGQLLEALGIELGEEDNAITKYQEVRGEIDQLIEKTRALAILRANEDSYQEALANEKQARRDLIEAQKTQVDLQERYDSIIANGAEELVQQYLDLTKYHNGYADSVEEFYDKLKSGAIDVSEMDAGIQMWYELRSSLEEANQTAADMDAEYSQLMATIENTEAVQKAIESGEGLEEALMRLSEGFITAEVGTKESLTRQVQSYTDYYETLKSEMERGNTLVTEEMVQSAANMVMLSSGELSKLPGTAAEALSALGPTLAATINEANGDVEPAISATMLSIATEYAKMPAEARAALEPMSAETVAAIEQAMDAMGLSANQGMQELMEILRGEREGFTENGLDLITGLIEGFESGSEALNGSIETVANGANTRWKDIQMSHSPSELWKGFGVDLLEGLRIGIEEGTEPVVAQVEGLALAARTPVEPLPAIFGEIGTNAGNAIAAGIESAVTRVKAAADKIVSEAKRAAEAAAKISSPSKVFMELGGYMGEGMAIGIENSIPEVSRAVEEMVQTASGKVNFGETTFGESSGGFTQNITVNSPQALSPSEVARQTKIATQGMVLQLRLANG